MFLFSILFLLMTLAAYAAEKSLRDHLHGKMTVVFLGNLTICFIVAALSWFQVNCPKECDVLYSSYFLHNNLSQVAEVDSGGCVLSGYLIQVLVLEAKIFICLSYLVFGNKDIHMLIFTFSSISSWHSSSASTPSPSTPICRSA